MRPEWVLALGVLVSAQASAADWKMDPAPSRLEFVATFEKKNGDVNRAIRGPEWFDFARFPQAEFHADDIRRVAPGRYLARGVLSLKGMKKDLEVPFTWQESANAATMEGELNVERLQFGIGTGEWADGKTIGLGVRVKFNVRLRKVG